MCEPVQVRKQVTYHSGNWGDKHYFAPFLNLSVSNFTSVMEALALQLGQAPENREATVSDRLASLFHKQLSTADWKKRIKLISQYFPVVRYLNGMLIEKEINGIREKANTGSRALIRKFTCEEAMRTAFIHNFSSLIITLDRLRSYYTYYRHDPITLHPDPHSFYRLMDDLFTDVARDVFVKRVRFSSTKEALKQNLTLDFLEMVSEKRDQLHRKDQQLGSTKTPERNWRMLSNAVIYDAFSPMIGKNISMGISSSPYRAEPAGTGDPTSTASLLFLCSCFLSTHQMERMKQGVHMFHAKGDDNDSKLKLMALHWVYNHLTFRGLKQNTVHHFESLLVRVMDELSKVPDPLYRVTKDKRAYFLAINPCCAHHLRDSNGVNHDPAIDHTVRKRTTERFPSLALRYLDEVVGFKNLRFQVYVGDYIHDQRVKTRDLSGRQIHRTVKERVNVFGRLSRVIKAKRDLFCGTGADGTGSQLWEPFQEPQYNITEGGIYIHLKLEKLGYPREAREMAGRHPGDSCREKRIPKREIVAHILAGDQGYQGQPTALLSLNELPALLYELLVNKKSPEEIEQTLAGKVVSQYQKIRDFSGTPGQLQDAQLPDNLRKAAKKDQKNLKKLKNHIARDWQAVIDQREQLRDMKRQYRQGKRKRLLSIYEIHDMAQWIARDIKNLMPPQTKAQWKLYDQKELQNGLANYQSGRLEVRTLLESKWNMTSEGPFWSRELRNLFKNKDLWSFLLNYLHLKSSVLKQLLDTIELTRNNKKLLKQALEYIFILYKPRIYTINSMDKEKEKLLNQPVVLPRGLFDPKPSYIKGTSLENNPQRFASWLVYLRKEAKTDHQKFYDLERDYTKAYNVIWDKKKYKHLNHFIYKTDKAIRKCMQNDVVLKLIANDLLKNIRHNNTDNHPVNISLSEMFLPIEEVNTLKQKAWSQHKGKPVDIKHLLCQPEEVYNISFLKCFDHICFRELPLKDFDYAQKLAGEDRVKRLESWHNRPWTLRELEEELLIGPDAYETIQQYEFFKIMHDLERGVFLNNNHKDAFSIQQLKHSFTSLIVNGVLKDHPRINESDYAFLTGNNADVDYDLVRNSKPMVRKAFFLLTLHGAFAVNRLPGKPVFELMIEDYKHLNTSTYSRFLMNVTRKIVDELVGDA